MKKDPSDYTPAQTEWLKRRDAVKAGKPNAAIYRKNSAVTQASILMTALSTSACQGDIMSEMQKALEDGRIDTKEHDALQTTIQDAMVALRTLSVQISQTFLEI